MEIRNNKGFVKWLLIGISVIFLLIMLVLPLVYVVYTALREGWRVFVSFVSKKAPPLFGFHYSRYGVKAV